MHQNETLLINAAIAIAYRIPASGFDARASENRRKVRTGYCYAPFLVRTARRGMAVAVRGDGKVDHKPWRVLMRKLFLLAAVLLIAATSAQAQNSHPRFEVFGGYSYLSRDISFDDPFDDDAAGFFNQREGVHGLGFSLAGNFHPNVGVVADFSYHKRELELPGNDIDFSNMVFLFGPRFTARGDRVEGFAHGLIGGVRSKVEDFDSNTDLALGFGGGVDIKVHPSVAIRAVQLDYIPIRVRDPITLDKEWSNNLRVQIGVTFRIQ